MATGRFVQRHGGIFTPEDLQLIQKLFDELCSAQGYAPDSEDAEYVGLLVVTLFKSGIVDENSLRKALEDCCSNSRQSA